MDATTFFLTYPRADLHAEDILAVLGTVKPIVWSRVAREQHEDGGLHAHVLVKFGDRVRTRNNMALFDVAGRHPNIQTCRSVKKVLSYLAKGSDFEDTGPVPQYSSEGLYEDLAHAAKSGNRPAFDGRALEARLSLQWADRIWATYNSTNTVLTPGQGTECVQLQQLQYDSGSIVIVGPSGCGKSTWAKRVAPKPALWVSHIDDLKKFNGHKCIIFDDMSFAHMPREAQIHIVDQYDIRSIHCRHSTATIPANTPKIFTANSFPFVDDEAIKRRIRVFNIVTFVL